MFPLGFVFGAIAGAAGVLILGPQFTQQARPVAKAVLKAALIAMHEAQVRSAEIAKAELVAETFAASAAAQTKAESVHPAADYTNGSVAREASARAKTQPARRRTAAKRSRAISKPSG
jgi:gas vesicle protein